MGLEKWLSNSTELLAPDGGLRVLGRDSRGPDSGSNFPDTLISVPDICEILPVNFLREFREKSLWHTGFRLGNCLQKGRNRKIPC